MRKQAFTLIELLIVVAIIAILAAIAVPNFLEAQVRSKVSRAKNDLRNMATALESYFVDNNEYPVDNGNQVIATPSGSVTIRRPPGDPTTANRTFGIALSTPIAYISSMEAAVDIFRVSRGDLKNLPALNGRDRLAFVNYHMLRKIGVPSALGELRNGLWSMYSAGPDQYFFYNGQPLVRDYENFSTAPPGGFPAGDGSVPYDSTNGTVSYGDIFRTQLDSDVYRPRN